MEKQTITNLEQPNIVQSTSQGEEVSQLKNRVEVDKNELGSKFGKFKDAESLLQAYNALQSDYTKKCQSLSEILKTVEENENKNSLIDILSRKDFINTPEIENKEAEIKEEILNSDINKSLKNTKERLQEKGNSAPRNWQQEVNKFFSIYPVASEYSNDLASIIEKNENVANSSNPLDSAWAEYTKQNFESHQSIANNENFLQNYIYNNKKIKDKILSDYFSNINFENNPKLIGSQKGASVVLSPTSKPKSIREASKLVEDMFS